MNNVILRKWSIVVASLIPILIGACAEFYNIAQGTGTWWNGFAFSWAIFFVAFCSICLFLTAGSILLVANSKALVFITEVWFKFRERIGAFRWVLSLVIGALPVLLFQVSVSGIVFQGFFTRIIIWILVVFFLTILISEKEKAINWKHLVSIIVFTGGSFAIASTLRNVTNYPFSLGWSEGNRLWDYSIMFGRDRYLYPQDEKIFVLLSPGRQLVGGLPFLFSGNNILTQRLWDGLINIVPYIILGIALFGFENRNFGQYLLLIIWTYLFLSQGPIHPPLVLSAFLVALAWRSPLWAALPLVVISAGFAGVSRYTWMFAPALWIIILDLSKISPKGDRTAWTRLLLMSTAALVAGALLPQILLSFQNEPLSFQSFIMNSDAMPGNVQEKISRQALLWYRLLPNDTYTLGILAGLATAILPLLLLLFHLYRIKIWRTTRLQKLVFISTTSAFLAVGLIVSTKIGGGADLHNMDMLLIVLAFIAAVVWNEGGKEWLINSADERLEIKILLLALIVIPAISPLKQMRSHGFYNLSAWLVTLTDASSAKALDLIPSREIVDSSLEIIRSNIKSAQHSGEILFVDQRQLLTFGYVNGVPLVPEYDKKVLIERAFTQNREYFNKFYSDLENKRFSLIITQPLTTEVQGSEDQFGEENNAWVKWVTKPVLCFYDIKLTLWEVNVQLLTPRAESISCSRELP